MTSLTKFLPLTESTYYIMLSLTEPLHGYGIMQKVKQLSGGSIDLAPGTLYGALDNLKKQKLIHLISEDAEKRRKVYLLSEQGREVLQLEFNRMRTLVSISSPLLNGENET